MWFSLNLSGLRFSELLSSVNLCLSPNLGITWPLFLPVFFCLFLSPLSGYVCVCVCVFDVYLICKMTLERNTGSPCIPSGVRRKSPYSFHMDVLTYWHSILTNANKLWALPRLPTRIIHNKIIKLIIQELISSVQVHKPAWCKWFIGAASLRCQLVSFFGRSLTHSITFILTFLFEFVSLCSPSWPASKAKVHCRSRWACNEEKGDYNEN